MMHQLRFGSMDTEVGLWLVSRAPGASAALTAARHVIEEYARALSRFRPDSELSRLNAAAGRGPQAVSPMLYEVVRVALEQARGSRGLFDPTVRGRVVGFRRVTLGDGTVALPSGAELDLGGIAKGYLADRVAEQLARVGPALVDAGGDMRALGQDWPVGVRNPLSPERQLAVLRLRDQAAATSSVTKRGRHLIDPRTGQPSESDVHTAVVVAPTAVEAETAAKAALLLGRREGGRYLAERGLEGWLL